MHKLCDIFPYAVIHTDWLRCQEMNSNVFANADKVFLFPPKLNKLSLRMKAAHP